MQIVLFNPVWIEVGAFAGFRCIPVDNREAFAANTLTLGGITLVSAAHPRTERALRAYGIETRAINISELQKAEARSYLHEPHHGNLR